MGYHKVSEPEDITNQYTHSGEEAVPLTSSTKLTTEKQQTITDEVPPHLEPYLQTQPTFGLTDDQVIERRNRFGRNELTEKKRNKLLHFLSFFTGAISYLMEISLILTALTKDWLDFGIILGMLIINAIIGYVEESRAESAIASLKDSLALHCRCWRNGQLTEIASRDIVVGDIIVLRLGDIVPADAKLLGIGASGEAIETDIQVDQSSLTGESLPAKKKPGSLIYSSCVVKQGQQQAIVVRTGPDTFIGRTASLITVTTDSGRFQKVINYIGNFLIIISIVLVLILFVYDLIEQRNTTGTISGDQVLAILNEMVVLTIAAIPVGLPTVMSVTMAIGAKQLAKRQVIVKRLTAVEEFASVSILCSDKTGTLTKNELTFDEPYLAGSYSKDDILLYSYLASEVATDDPIEFAVRTAAETHHPQVMNDGSHTVQGYKVTSFKPFNPVDKTAQATVQDTATLATFRVAKGAPPAIFEMVGGNKEAEEMVNSFASRGLRSLGVARTVNGMEDWELIGLLSFIDPPRNDSAETLAECQRYGISVKMITGDQRVIAKEVAGRLGMGQNIMDADELVDPSKSEQEVSDMCLYSDGFARVIPEHKYKVVELLQERGYFVAMTGDGVNDAPALKKANVGIAVAGATDAARSASDIVLLEPGLSAIIDGIKTSRVIFQRLQSYALYRITSTIHFLLFFFVITLAEDWKMPPVFLILISLLNDAATLIMAVDNVSISHSPNMWRLRLLIVLSCVLAVALSLFSFAHFYIFRDVLHVAPEELSTIMYLHISSAPHFVIFSTRTNTFWWKSMPSLVFSVIVLGTQVIALFLSVYGVGQSQNISGIGWPRGLIIIAISLAIFLIIDLIKVLTIFIWEKIEKNPSTTSTFASSKKKPTTKAAAFVQRSRFGYDRAMRRESDSSIKSY
ncbi:plasma-membrane proton-efflux P-type ATPase [Rhizopus microsporus var. microsporus]|uniref:Plasma membrane ATPase n=2 Tax=Rhizopus microsporus TaxID=58291 RepID=A0A2G4T024_RHIZD|nr:H(+)-ATPase [Rhizopus microsporus ATCC 52813]ORE11319.1 plasma-membrane proton-efflux P-type ATPase [Rhizopus microsporus var. microsporus]PHZ14372.1 H(+)-ATPase [Rhizopus microsporus ATCC 52813]